MLYHLRLAMIFFRRHYSRVFPKEKITTAQTSSWAYVLLEVVMVIFSFFTQQRSTKHDISPITIKELLVSTRVIFLVNFIKIKVPRLF